ncbi:MAG: hypothetical protein WAV78_28575, partial [Xanthobacteraceae bacterium]
LNETGRDGCSKVEPVIVRDASGLSMRAEVGGGGRATGLRPLMIAPGVGQPGACSAGGWGG